MQGQMHSVHVAPLHRRDDVRILLKECTSLAGAGLDVTLVVADGKGDAIHGRVSLVDAGEPPAGKFAKRLVPLFKSAQMARKMRPDVIHFHDGLFLPFALGLALLGHRVIYDVHEDYPDQVMNLRFPNIIKQTAGLGYKLLEGMGGKLFCSIVAATPHIARKFPRHKTILVQNLALSANVKNDLPNTYNSRPKTFAYVGGLAVHRGTIELVQSLEMTRHADICLNLAGAFSPKALEDDLARVAGWGKVHFRGWVGRSEVRDLLGQSRAGMMNLHPTKNYIHSLPVKLFEYMAAGLPVIASDFPLWRTIIEKERCGLLVDPLNPQSIADAMDWIIDNPSEAEAMGARGREAAMRTYNWDVEARKLLECYRKLEAS